MSNFLDKLTFWRVVAILVIIGAASWALARVVYAARGKNLDAELYSGLGAQTGSTQRSV